MSDRLLHYYACQIVAESHPLYDDLVQAARIAQWRRGVSGRGVRNVMLDELDAWARQTTRVGSGAGSKPYKPPRDRPVSLYNDDGSHWDVADGSADPADVAVARDTWRRLSSRERMLLSQACGGWTLDDQAEARGVTRSRACQLRQEARRALAA